MASALHNGKTDAADDRAQLLAKIDQLIQAHEGELRTRLSLEAQVKLPEISVENAKVTPTETPVDIETILDDDGFLCTDLDVLGHASDDPEAESDDPEAETVQRRPGS